MCTARSGKYTDVPRSYASRSSALPSRHVVRDVRDVHAEPVVAVRQLLDRDRIVEIARVLAVDGHGQHVAEVGAASDVAFSETADAETHRFGDRVGGVGVGDAVLADDDLGVDAGRVDVAEHLGHAADGAARRRRPARQLHRDHVARATRRLPAPAE